MSKTYTIATLEDMVIATVLDGQDVFQAAAEEAERAGIELDFGDLQVTEGVTLADEEEEGDKIVFRAGPHTGCLMDEEGRRYSLAVIRKAITPVLTVAEMAAILRANSYEVWNGSLGYDTRPYVGRTPLPVGYVIGYAEAFREPEEVPEWRLEEALESLEAGEVVTIPDYWGSNYRGEWSYERTLRGFVALGYRAA